MSVADAIFIQITFSFPVVMEFTRKTDRGDQRIEKPAIAINSGIYSDDSSL